MHIEYTTTEFDNFPIEFKEINPEDFLTSDIDEHQNICENRFIVEDKIILDVEEYINDELQQNIDLLEKNTVVVNASVGQGKSYAIIQTIKRYYEEEDNYLIIVASPFVSLVKQYCNDIHTDGGIPESDIYNYDNLGRTEEAYLGKKVQVLTVNTLLGNPGEDGFKNSDIKRNYIDNLISDCIQTGTKVIFIYDEIHDSFHNFKEKYIFNLWKWRRVIHKNFILSATYNEASKVVIEYLAELTDRKIKILESKRNRNLEKQSPLYLHFSDENRFDENTSEIVSVVEDCILRGRNIDILCYSKKLAKGIIDSNNRIGKQLEEKYGEVKDCTSELFVRQRMENEAPKNQFDNSKCNVGTNFKTGVSIKKENHTLIIILPPRSTRLNFSNLYGIFSGGINSIIQALARQRNTIDRVGEIHIVLPKPDKFDVSSLELKMNESQREAFQGFYNLINHYSDPEHLIEYLPLEKQDEKLKSFYSSELKGYVQDEIDHIDGLDRNIFNNLRYPSFNSFKLEEGEKYLAESIPFYGGDISAYVVYSALTHQFINCRLKAINVKPTIFFTEGQIQEELSNYYINFFGLDHYNTVARRVNFSYLYYEIRNELFDNNRLVIRKISGEYVALTSSKPETKFFELQTLYYVSKIYPNQRDSSLRENQEISIGVTGDPEYPRGEYLNSNLSALVHNTSNQATTDIEQFYGYLLKFLNKITDYIKYQNNRRPYFHYLPLKPFDDFYTEEFLEDFAAFKALICSDRFFEIDVFDLKRNLNKSDEGKNIISLYRILVKDFFKISERQPQIKIFEDKPKIRVYKVLDISHKISYGYNINLIESPKILDL